MADITSSLKMGLLNAVRKTASLAVRLLILWAVVSLMPDSETGAEIARTKVSDVTLSQLAFVVFIAAAVAIYLFGGGDD